MEQILLTQGKVALVDDCDYPQVILHKWQASRHADRWYAVSEIDGKMIAMHRLITGFPPFALDHRNRNGLDNQRLNLREATGTQNNANMRKPCRNTSGYKGVSRRKGKWEASITVCRTKFYLGRFFSKLHAAAAYRMAAQLYFGEFARI